MKEQLECPRKWQSDCTDLTNSLVLSCPPGYPKRHLWLSSSKSKITTHCHLPTLGLTPIVLFFPVQKTAIINSSSMKKPWRLITISKSSLSSTLVRSTFPSSHTPLNLALIPSPVSDWNIPSLHTAPASGLLKHTSSSHAPLCRKWATSLTIKFVPALPATSLATARWQLWLQPHNQKQTSEAISHICDFAHALWWNIFSPCLTGKFLLLSDSAYMSCHL